MTHSRISQLSRFATLVLLVAVCSFPTFAQQTTTASAVVPTLVQFSGVLTNSNGKPLTEITGVTFYLYQEQEGGASLWMETQNVQPNQNGQYTVMLGSTSSTGLPTNIFASGEAHWLGVQAQGQPEQPRVMLLSVPYALKAGDAATVGGLPPSAFVLAAPPVGGGEPTAAAATGSPSSAADHSVSALTVGGSGQTNYIPLWTNSSTLGDSVLYQSGSNLGLGTTDPQAALHVVSNNSPPTVFVDQYANVLNVMPTINRAARGTPSSPSAVQAGDWLGGVAVRGYGKTGFSTGQGQVLFSAAENWTDTAHGTYVAFKDTPVGTVNMTERMRIDPAGNVGIGTTTPAALLEVNGTGRFDGLVSFASGQTFPGTGTITGVTAGTDLTGGGTMGAVTLNLDTTKVPQLNTSNTFTGNQTVNGNMSATGVVAGSSFNIGSNAFAFGSYFSGNAFLGFAGNTTTTGVQNTATGLMALSSSTSGNDNTANGFQALQDNTTGGANTATGSHALEYNTTGSGNTACGDLALQNNTTGNYNSAFGGGSLSGVGFFTGSNNTALGYIAGGVASTSAKIGSGNTFVGEATAVGLLTGVLNNATAIGANAEVSESNALVLGSINGVNGATANTSVGIGTTAPASALDIFRYNIHSYIGGACSTDGFGGITFGNSGFTGCTNYSLLGDGTNTFINAPSGTISFRIANNTPSAMVINASGQVGIGGSPDQTLSVTTGSADKPGGGSWGTYSDRRLKTLGGSYRSGLSQILKIHPVRYRYKEENAMGIRDADEHVGLVAQEVQQVIPEAVTENNKGYLLVNNDPIIWAMLNAIKEQQGLIRKQKQQIRAQQAQLKAQQLQITAQRTQGQIQQAQIAQLMSQMQTIQASLDANGRTGLEVRTVKAQVPMARQ